IEHQIPRPMKRICFSILAIAGVLIFAKAPAYGDPVTWNNTGTDFNSPTSWVSGLPGVGDNATFVGAANVQPQLTGDIQIQGLTFSGAEASGYVLSRTGGSLTLTNSGGGASSSIYAQN